MQQVRRQRLSLVRQWQLSPGATRQTAPPARPASGPAPTASCALSPLLTRAEYAFGRSATAKLIFAGSRLAGAGQNPTHNLPIGIATECNSPHRLSGEGVDLREISARNPRGRLYKIAHFGRAAREHGRVIDGISVPFTFPDGTLYFHRTLIGMTHTLRLLNKIPPPTFRLFVCLSIISAIGIMGLALVTHSNN